ncbi:hypothetical protein BJ878DRAFT_493628 [Calycina marina]|uniref:Uncharacterized protein n=1 Tax=Calycina marina TaxID=1763456 RepID=A0A9P7Z8D2_9HELO|nr:hypothetical protein BJ878DRAFT_493628 [Calycina marina]
MLCTLLVNRWSMRYVVCRLHSKALETRAVVFTQDALVLAVALGNLQIAAILSEELEIPSRQAGDPNCDFGIASEAAAMYGLTSVLKSLVSRSHFHSRLRPYYCGDFDTSRCMSNDSGDDKNHPHYCWKHYKTAVVCAAAADRAGVLNMQVRSFSGAKKHELLQLALYQAMLNFSIPASISINRSHAMSCYPMGDIYISPVNEGT